MAAGLFYMLDFQGNEQKKTRLYCRDDHDTKMVTYLVKTQAEYWMGDVGTARYTLNYNAAVFDLDSTSYKPENTTTGPDGTTLSWRFENFRPDRELVIYFHKKK